MVHYPNLVSAMAVREISQKEIAKAIGISDRALYKKMNGDVAFKFPEAVRIQADFFPDVPILDLFAPADNRSST